MLLKIAVLLTLVCVLCRWALGKWPWQYMDAPPSRSQASLWLQAAGQQLR